jgi:hypothetical protein
MTEPRLPGINPPTSATIACVSRDQNKKVDFFGLTDWQFPKWRQKESPHARRHSPLIAHRNHASATNQSFIPPAFGHPPLISQRAKQRLPRTRLLLTDRILHPSSISTAGVSISISSVARVSWVRVFRAAQYQYPVAFLWLYFSRSFLPRLSSSIDRRPKTASLQA